MKKVEKLETLKTPTYVPPYHPHHNRNFKGIFWMLIVLGIFVGFIFAFTVANQITGQTIFTELKDLFSQRETLPKPLDDSKLGGGTPDPFDYTVNKKPEWLSIDISSKLLLEDPFEKNLDYATFYNIYNTLSAYEMFELNKLQIYAKNNYGNIQNMINRYPGKTIVFYNNNIITFNTFDEVASSNQAAGSLILTPSTDGYNLIHLVGSIDNYPIEHITKEMWTRINSLKNYVNLRYGSSNHIINETGAFISKSGNLGMMYNTDVLRLKPSDCFVLGDYIYHVIGPKVNKVGIGISQEELGPEEPVPVDSTNKKPEWFTVTVSSSLVLQDPYIQGLSPGTFYDRYNTISAYELFELNKLQIYAKNNYGNIQNMINRYPGKTIIFYDNTIQLVNSFIEAVSLGKSGAIILLPRPNSEKADTYSVIHLVGSIDNYPIEHITKEAAIRLNALKEYASLNYGSYLNIPQGIVIGISKEGNFILPVDHKLYTPSCSDYTTLQGMIVHIICKFD